MTADQPKPLNNLNTPTNNNSNNNNQNHNQNKNGQVVSQSQPNSNLAPGNNNRGPRRPFNNNSNNNFNSNQNRNHPNNNARSEQQRDFRNDNRDPRQNNNQRNNNPQNNINNNVNNNLNNNRRPPQRQNQGGPPRQNNQGGRNNNSNQNNNQPASFDQILIQYDRLLFLHNEARKKYYEYYYRVDYQRLEKLEDQFYRTGVELRQFERNLKPHQQRDLRELKIDYFPEDNEYTTNHPKGEEGLPQIQFDEKAIHIKETQVSRTSYRDDREITDGTFEDYLQYKKTNN